MNKSDLKNFAINARLALLQRVADRAALYGIDEEKCQSRAIVPSSAFHMLDGSVLSAQEVGQRNALIARISKIGYRQTMEVQVSVNHPVQRAGRLAARHVPANHQRGRAAFSRRPAQGRFRPGRNGAPG